MATFFPTCAYDTHTLASLSASQLRARQSRLYQVGFGLLALLALVMSTACIVDTYMVAVAGWAMVPALIDIDRKRRVISAQLKSHTRS